MTDWDDDDRTFQCGICGKCYRAPHPMVCCVELEGGGRMTITVLPDDDDPEPARRP